MAIFECRQKIEFTDVLQNGKTYTLTMSETTPAKLNTFSIRQAVPADVTLILQFIKKLGAYEKLSHEVVATEEKLRKTLFEQKMAEVIIGEYEGEPVGFALFFHNYSTFLGQAGIYLEDLFIDPGMRGKGFGTKLLRAIETFCKDNGATTVQAGVEKENTACISLLQKNGYSKTVIEDDVINFIKTL